MSHCCMEHLRIFIAWMTPSGQRLPQEVAPSKRQLAAGLERFCGVGLCLQLRDTSGVASV